MSSVRRFVSLLGKSIGVRGAPTARGQVRRLATAVNDGGSPKQVEEIRVPVPWGHLAGKWWGPKDRRPLLALHGWQDNCNSYDNLIPHLPNEIGVLAIDFPGHGYSSQLPEGVPYTPEDFMLSILRVSNYFNWDKISIMAHSMGSITTFRFASMMPEKMDLYIALDSFNPMKFETSFAINACQKGFRKFLVYEELQKKSQPPSYTYEELVERLYIGEDKTISRENCPIILQRGAAQSLNDPNKYYYVRDQRLKCTMHLALPADIVEEMAKRITCPVMIIKALGSPYMNDEYSAQVRKVVQANNDKFEYFSLEGTHHVHMNDAKAVAVPVSNFLNRYFGK